MKRLIWLILLSWSLVFSGSAQDLFNKDIDELRGMLERPVNRGTLRVNILNELGFKLMLEQKGESATQFAQEAIALAEGLEYLEGQAAGWNVLGNVARDTGGYEQAEVFFRKALDLRIKDNNKVGVASCYNNIGLLDKDYRSNYKKAEESFQKGLAQLKGARVGIGGALHNNLGDVLTRMGRYYEALDHINTSIDIWKELGSAGGLAWAELNLAILFQEIKDYSNSDTLLMGCLETFEKENNLGGQAKSYLLLGNNAFYRDSFHQALQLYKKADMIQDGLNPGDRAIVYRNRGSSYFQLGQYEKALPSYLACKDIFVYLKNDREVAAIDFDIGNYYYAQEQYDQALGFFESSREILERVQAPQLESQVLLYLSSTYRGLKQYDEAFGYAFQYFALKDGLASSTRETLILDRELKETLLEQEQAKKRRWIIYSIIGFVILWLSLATAVLYAYNEQKKKKVALQDVDNLLQKQELNLYDAREKAQDEERSRIARDLHDGLGSILTTIKLYFDDLASKITEMQEEARKQYQKVDELLDRAFTSVRSIAHKMDTLARLGLDTTLELFAEEINGTNRISVELATHGLGNRLDKELEKEVFRIIQELTSNTLKYARAKKLTIQVNRFDDLVNIMVEDNGVGFDLEQAKKKGGLGLRSIEYRVENLGGTFQIDTRKGNGATVMIDIPLEKELS